MCRGPTSSSTSRAAAIGHRIKLLPFPIKFKEDTAEYRDVAVALTGNARKAKRSPLFEHHDYHDHANDAPPAVALVGPEKNAESVSFPRKLYNMLNRVERDGVADIISWQPHGRCFVVHRYPEFKSLLPRYFKLTKIASFQRQLNLYGFKRITKGRDRNGYYHELFLKGRPHMVGQVTRFKIKGTGIRPRANPSTEPNFYDNYPWVGGQDEDPSLQGQHRSTAIFKSNTDTDEKEDDSMVLDDRDRDIYEPIPINSIIAPIERMVIDEYAEGVARPSPLGSSRCHLASPDEPPVSAWWEPINNPRYSLSSNDGFPPEHVRSACYPYQDSSVPEPDLIESSRDVAFEAAIDQLLSNGGYI